MGTTRFIASLAAFILLYGSSAPIAAQNENERVVTGRVIDNDDQPVSGADIASYWDSSTGEMLPTKWALSHADGSFTTKIRFHGRPTVVMALDDDRQRGGLIVLNEQNIDQPVTIILKPQVTIRGDFICQELGRSPQRTLSEVSLLLEGDQSAESKGDADADTNDANRAAKIDVAICHPDSAAFSFTLPPGRYMLRGNAIDMEDIYQEVILSGEEPHLDLGTIDMKLAPLARLYGKPAPDWNITEARGIEQAAKISDYKGKWLLLEFWGYWCGPCIHDSLPGLMQLYEQHASARDKFEIIAIHHQGANSLAELDEKMKPVIEDVWLGKTLPFPIIVDAEDKTVDSYGVDNFPTAVLIDPDGRVVRQASASMLNDILQGRNTPSHQPVEAFLDKPAKPQPPPASPKAREHIKTDEHILLSGHADIVSSIAFSPDGRRIATGSSDVSVKVWDAETGQNLSTFRRSNHWIFAAGLPVAFLPDGETLVTVTLNRVGEAITRSVEFWNLNSGTAEDVTLNGVNDCGTHFALSQDGTTLVTGAWDEQQKAYIVRLCDFRARQVKHVLPATKYLWAIALSPDGQLLATGSGPAQGKSEVRLWNVQTGEELWSQPQSGPDVSGLAFSPDGRVLAVTNWDELVVLREVPTGNVVRTLRWPGHRAYSVAFSPDSRTLATGGVGNAASIRLWDWQTGEMRATLVVQSPKVASLTFSPDGRRLVSGTGSETYFGEAQIWRLDRILTR